MKIKEFIIKGAHVIVFQKGELVMFYMGYKTSDLHFCVGYKEKLSEITEEDAYCVWHEYIDLVIESENAIIAHLEAQKQNRKGKKKARNS